MTMKLFLISLACLLGQASAYADKVDAWLKEQMGKGRIPGLAVGIIQNGRLIKAGTYGYADLEQKTRVGRDTAFEVGAITKQFTAAGILLLAEAGRLSLDDRIAAHLTNTPAAWSNITVRQLLNHTSGIKSYTGLTNDFGLSRHLTQRQFIATGRRLSVGISAGGTVQIRQHRVFNCSVT